MPYSFEEGIIIRNLFLVDTENINSEWKGLLEHIGKNDEILLFYTERTGGISYPDFEYIIKYQKHLKFIECATGPNALDFQLVSYVGYLMKTGVKTKYIIVSNDKGYDAILNFWKKRDRNIIRISSINILKNELFDDNSTSNELIKTNTFSGIDDNEKYQWIVGMLNKHNITELAEIHNELLKRFGQKDGSEYYRIIKPQLHNYYNIE